VLRKKGGTPAGNLRGRLEAAIPKKKRNSRCKRSAVAIVRGKKKGLSKGERKQTRKKRGDSREHPADEKKVRFWRRNRKKRLRKEREKLRSYKGGPVVGAKLGRQVRKKEEQIGATGGGRKAEIGHRKKVTDRGSTAPGGREGGGGGGTICGKGVCWREREF